jgi:phenylpyruvate tautomerase PptA (4-oxalocrotonate tautomerase family)
MPYVTIVLREGRSVEQKHNLARAGSLLSDRT